MVNGKTTNYFIVSDLGGGNLFNRFSQDIILENNKIIIYII
jgi:hypothetical protein